MGDQARLAALEPLIGEWTLTAHFPGDQFPSDPGAGEVPARSTFEWLLDGAFLVQRSSIDHPAAPDAYSIVQADPARVGHYVQHYFDSRGVVRVYAMTFDGRAWTLTRTEPDFTPLEFAQRFTGTLSDDGRVIDGQWESGREDGEGWELDFRLRYTKR